MELPLDEFVSILDVIKKLSWFSLPLWLSLCIPAYYILLKKIIRDSNSNENTVNIEAVSSTMFGRFQVAIKKLFTLPQMSEVILWISVCLLIIGSITVIIDQQIAEDSRNNGLRIKNYLLTKSYYSVAQKDIANELNFTDKQINRVLKYYPNEFIKLNGDTTIVMVDSALVKRIITRSEKLLDSYLSNPIHMQNACISLNSLFQVNNCFTYPVCHSLMIDSAHKYCYAICEDGTQGIVKKF